MSGTIPALLVTNPVNSFMFGKMVKGKKLKKKRGEVAMSKKGSAKKRQTKGTRRQLTRSSPSVSPLTVMPYNFGSALPSYGGKRKTKKKARSMEMAKDKKKYRNPIAKALSVKTLGYDTKRLVVDGALITGGYLGMSVIENFLPVNVKANDYLKLGVKLGVAIVTGMVLGKAVSKDTAIKVSSGMAVNVVLDALQVFNLTRFLPIPQQANTSTELPPTTTTGTGVIVNGNRTSGLGVILNKASL